ncbi:uncharacterized protein LOC123523765 [Mercenaria mercenaria]|uniref:uncharacterized protein LOC123523765 n=1 Tax=Mercenaria mercenaria TaxID=6596 RepID=UPI00234E865B|nr:uncharacterized protein LOC123523765 [Mercenaria mercenaria]
MFPAMSGHQILDKADFGSRGLQATELPSYPIERCSTHKAKLLDMFCGNYDEVECASCVAINHRACQDIRSIPDDIDNLYRESSFGETKTKLDTMKKTVEDIKKSKEQLVEQLKKHKNKIKETEKFNVDLAEYYKKLERSAGNKAQEFVCVKETEKTIVKVEKAEQILREEPSVEIQFEPDVKIKDFLNQFKTLGKISITSTNLKLKTTVYTKRAQNGINVKVTKDGSKCCIFGSCFISDGSLLLTDYKNTKLKHVDISTATVKDHLDLNAGPFYVCQISDDEAAVSLENETIQFVSLGDKLTNKRQLKLGHRCNGVAYINGILFISDESKSVYMYDMNGTMLNRIATDKSGKEIFHCSQHISYSINRSRVYVADQYKGLIALDIQGNYQSTFTDPELERACGVCTDRRRNILVCGLTTNVIQTNEDNTRKVGTLRNMIYSHSACFDPHKNRLVLTSSSDTVRVYELE